MAGFLSLLAVQEIPGDDRHWRLLEPCVYHLKDEDGEEWVEAPAGFITDFGSIPRPLWSFPGLSPTGRYRRAYVIHDKLYVAPVVRSEAATRVITRREADDILGEALSVLEASWWDRFKILTGVRVGGWRAWRRRRKADAKP